MRRTFSGGYSRGGNSIKRLVLLAVAVVVVGSTIRRAGGCVLLEHEFRCVPSGSTSYIFIIIIIISQHHCARDRSPDILHGHTNFNKNNEIMIQTFVYIK